MKDKPLTQWEDIDQKKKYCKRCGKELIAANPLYPEYCNVCNVFFEKKKEGRV